MFLPAPVSKLGIESQRRALGTAIDYNIMPFQTICGIIKGGNFIRIVIQIGGNVALFIPMPIFFMLMGKIQKSACFGAFPLCAG